MYWYPGREITTQFQKPYDIFRRCDQIDDLRHFREVDHSSFQFSPRFRDLEVEHCMGFRPKYYSLCKKKRRRLLFSQNIDVQSVEPRAGQRTMTQTASHSTTSCLDWSNTMELITPGIVLCCSIIQLHSMIHATGQYFWSTPRYDVPRYVLVWRYIASQSTKLYCNKAKFPDKCM
jgi:hypothetical protein